MQMSVQFLFNFRNKSKKMISSRKMAIVGSFVVAIIIAFAVYKSVNRNVIGKEGKGKVL